MARGGNTVGFLLWWLLLLRSMGFRHWGLCGKRRGPGGRFPTGQPERSLSAPSRPSRLLGEGPTWLGDLAVAQGTPWSPATRGPLSAGADLSPSPHQAVQGR